MQLHQLKPIHKLKKTKRIGRGGKRGTYSGLGSKGQKARAGRRLKPLIRELIKRYPKLRGYRQKSKIKNQKSKMAILNLEVLEKKFNSGEKVSPKVLLERGLISKIKGRTPIVKILARGELTKALNIANCLISEAARDRINKAGGKISR